MAGMFMEWTTRRQFDTLKWQDAYWFAFISTTTVGLGDFYQTPEVLFINDLLYYSLSYLFGFVLLSTFLTELGNLLALYVPDLSVELEKRLQHVGLIPIPGVLHGARRHSTVAGRPDSTLNAEKLGSEAEQEKAKGDHSESGAESYS